MNTNIHHPSHHFRRTAIAAIVTGFLSPSVFAATTPLEVTYILPNLPITTPAASNVVVGTLVPDTAVGVTGSSIAFAVSSSLTSSNVSTPVITIANTNENTTFSAVAGGNTNLTSIYQGRAGAIGTTGTISATTGAPIVSSPGNMTGGTQSVAQVTLTNGLGITNGLQVFETNTTLSGSNITLNAANDINQNAANLTQSITNNISTTAGNIRTNAGNMTEILTGNLTQTVGAVNLTASQPGSVINLGKAGSSVTAQFGNFTNVNADNNITAGNNVSGNNLTATRDITAGNNISAINGNFSNNLTANGNVSALQNITAGNNITAASNISGRDITATNNMAAINGNFSNNLTANGNVSALQNITAGNNITAASNISGRDITATNNMAAINGNFSNNLTANGNVSALQNITAGNNITAASNISGRDITATNNMAAINGNFSNNLTANGNVSALQNITAGNNITATSNISGRDITATNNVAAINGNFSNNLSALGNISALQNITAGNNITAASNITGRDITATNNVAAINGNFSNNVSALGNISALQNITAGNNITAASNITGRDITATNNVAGINGNFSNNVSALGNISSLQNITAGNNITAASNITGRDITATNNVAAINGNFSNNVSALGNISALQNITAGNNITAASNITGRDVVATNNVTGINGNFTNLNVPGNATLGNVTAGNLSLSNGTLNLTNTTVIGFKNNLSQITGDLGVRGENATYASNGVTGNLTTGNLTRNVGAITTYNSSQTVAANTTIGNRLAGVQYQNLVNGNEVVDGNLYVNGNITATNANVTDLSATTFNVTGQTVMAGINNSGPLNNFGNLTNVGNTTLTGASNIISTPGGGSLTTNATGATLTGNNVAGQGLALNNNGSIALTGASAAGLTVNAAGTGVTLLNNVGAGHGLNITATGTTLSGGTNSSSITLNNNNAVIAVGTATTPEVNVINASNTNGNTSFASTANGRGSLLTSIYAANGTAAQGTSGNISSFTRDGATVPQTTNQGGVLGTTVSESSSSVLLTNGRGGTNGLQVFENRTNIAGDTINMMGNTTLGNVTFRPNSSVNFTGVNVTGLDGLNVTLTQIRGAAEPFASNGVNGTASLLDTNTGAGAMTTFKSTSVQTVAANTTIGNQLAGAKYQSLVNGNELIDGNLYVNGDTAFVGTNSATSTVVGKRSSSKLAGATTGIIGKTGITTGTPVTDIVTGATATESVAAVTLTNGNGQTGGLQVFEDRTSLSGGTNATTQVASNGINGAPAGQAPVGSGAITVYNAGNVQSVAPNTTIGDRLSGVQYQDKINGNTLVDGNLYVNGDTKFVGNTAATSTVVGGVGTSKFDPGASVSGQTGIQTSTATNPVPVTDIATGKTASESVASTTLTNGAGKTNGLQVFEDRTNLTGGSQQSSSLTLNNNGATFSTPTGAPAKVTGVADGTSKYDAVNFGQLQALSSDIGNVAERAYSGIAQSSAMSAIPAPMAGHHYSVGMGSGFYAGQQAIAFGGKADVGEHIRLSAAMGTGMGSTSQMSANAGAGFSW